MTSPHPSHAVRSKSYVPDGSPIFEVQANENELPRPHLWGHQVHYVPNPVREDEPDGRGVILHDPGSGQTVCSGIDDGCAGAGQAAKGPMGKRVKRSANLAPAVDAP